METNIINEEIKAPKKRVLLTKKEIRQLEAGEIPEKLQQKPFVIMRHWEKIITGSDVRWMWTIDLSPNRKDSMEIERSQALAIIQNFGMACTFKNKYGSIYEAPGNSFKKAFSN